MLFRNLLTVITGLLILSCGGNTSTPGADNKKLDNGDKQEYSRYEFPDVSDMIVTPGFDLTKLNRTRYDSAQPDFFITKRFGFTADRDCKMNLGYIQKKIDGCKESIEAEVMYSWLKLNDDGSTNFQTVDQNSWYEVKKGNKYQFVVSITNNARCKQFWLDYWMTSDHK